MKRTWLLPIVCLAQIAVGLPTPGATIDPNDDTFTYSGSSGTNYDGQGIVVKYSPTRYGWMEFTMGDTSVASAMLYVYNTWVNTGTQNIELRASVYNFSEGSLTWSNQPSGDSWTSLGTWSTTSGAKWYSLDITSIYNSNLGQTVTIRLKATSGSGDGPIFEDNENFKGSGNRPYIEYAIAGDTQPPSVPTNVSDTAQSGTSIQVTRTASTDNIGVSGYKVYRDGTHVGTSATTSYLDSGLTPLTTYSYMVSAYDGSGNNSAQSSPPPATATTMTGIDIAAAKQLPDSSTVGMIDKVVIAVLGDCFYIEATDRQSGIKVVPLEMPTGLAIGNTVDVGGTMQTSNGERRIADAEVTVH